MISPTHIPLPESAGTGRVYRNPMPRAIQLQKLKDSYKIHTIVQLCFDDEFESYRNSEVPRLYQQYQFNVIKFPIQDFGVPKSERETVETVNKILALLRDGNNVLIHCVGGKGRTGLMLACLARKIFNYDGPEAVRWIRKYFHAVETLPQERFVATYLERGQSDKQEKSLEDAPSECTTSSMSSDDSAAEDPIAVEPDQRGRQASDTSRQSTHSGASASSEDDGHIGIPIEPAATDEQDESKEHGNGKGFMQCCTVQ